MKQKTLAGVIAINSALIAGLHTADVSAQAQRQSATSAMLEEVVITARKRSESMQDVPIAVSAMNESQMDALKVRDISDVWRGMPNVNLSENGTIRGTANYAIRGVGVLSSIPAVDPVVGVFVDGVYLGQNNGLITDIFDMESVQVLRGPQGTLFGKNVTGGAVLMNTKKPEQEFEAKVRAAIDANPNGDGGMNRYTMGSVTGGLTDTFAAKLVAYYNNDDGWLENKYGGPDNLVGGSDDFGKTEVNMFRPSVRWTPTENLDIVLRYEYQKVEADGAAGQSSQFSPPQIGLPGSPYAWDLEGSHDFAIDNPGYDNRKLHFWVGQMDWDVAFGDGTVTNIAGYRELKSETSIDYDSQPVPALNAFGFSDYEQWSNELRYIGTFGQWSVTTGVYYFDSNVKYTEGRVLYTLAPFAINTWGGGDQDQTTYSWFGEAEYEINDAWRVGFGVNAARDDKSIKVAEIAPTADNQPCDVRNGSCPFGFDDNMNNTSYSPKASVTYQYSDDTMVYAQWARAYRSGFYSVRADYDVRLDAPGPTDEEQTDSYELGFKSEFAGRGRLNGAVFYNETSDLARIVQTPGPTGAIQKPINIGDSQMWGVELEGSWSLTDALLLTGSLGYLHNKYDDLDYDLNQDGIINGIDYGLDVVMAPEWTSRVGLVYDLELGDMGSLSLRASYAYMDEHYELEQNWYQVPGREMVDAGVDWFSSEGHWIVGIYGKNLTNEVYHGGVNEFPVLPAGAGSDDPYWGGGTYAPLAKGRTVGIDVTYEF
jgi:iron complex outermembrane recepter protein